MVPDEGFEDMKVDDKQPKSNIQKEPSLTPAVISPQRNFINFAQAKKRQQEKKVRSDF